MDSYKEQVLNHLQKEKMQMQAAVLPTQPPVVTQDMGPPGLQANGNAPGPQAPPQAASSTPQLPNAATSI
jgi:hypothetical protein